MNAAVFKQKVNFYISVTFILAFSIFITTTVVSAIDRDSSTIQKLEDPAGTVQQ